MDNTLNDIAVADEEIERLEKALTLMKSRRADLEQFLNNHNAYLSPARRVPPEIWYEIFQECVSHDIGSNSDAAVMFDRNFASLQPIALTHVCSDWREVVLSSPKLWSSLSLPLHTKLSSLCFMAQAWLGRSGECPLTLRIDQRERAITGVPSKPAQDLVNDIIATSHRWLNVDLNLHIPSCFLEAFTTVKYKLPTLERLAISFSQNGIGYNPYLATFAFAPKLHTVYLGYGPSVELQLPWHQLTHIVTESSSDISVDKHLEIIRWSTNLVSYTATLRPVANPGCMRDVKHAGLRTLTIDWNYDSNGSVPAFFNHLRLPSLQNVSIKLPGSRLPREFIAFIMRSGCHIRHLTLGSDKFSEEEHGILLLHMSTLSY